MKVVTAPGGQPALDLINGPRGDQITLMLLDLVMPDMGGLEVLAKLRATNPDLPVIVLTAKGGIDSAVEAMRAGANDFLVKPASPERIAVSIRNQLKIGTLSGEVKQLKKKTDNRLSFDDLIADSPEMKQVFRLGARAAQSDIPILIEGESGAGKELIARAIQGTSARAGKPFVTVNCGAIPENLIESILFGHEKGSFTGATDKHLGKFQEADGGTLFLDEIGELRLDMQVKLLRALQEGEVDPVGSKRPVKVDVRIISATNRDLGQMAREGSFREDLYYRLNVFPVLVPSLRDRPDDIAPLARHFIARFAAEENKPVVGPDAAGQPVCSSGSTGRAMCASWKTPSSAPWCCATAPCWMSAISRRSPPRWAWNAAHAPDAWPVAGRWRHRAARRCRRRLALCAWRSPTPPAISASSRRWNRKSSAWPSRRYDGHMSEVARRLGIGRSTLYRKLKEFGLETARRATRDADARTGHPQGCLKACLAHSQGGQIKVQHRFLFLEVGLVQFPHADHLAHDLGVEAGALGLGIDFADVGGERGCAPLPAARCGR